ncbi:Flagellar motor switch protein FliG [Alteripontixanthobacter maritimus]|uniref:Flagellar motor switch protein FliG n=1 Tax=Alteripontixanthobacter maritimus TaxID=2161824 RepID=A0A369QA26_9SPHN|nr:FliG C-terminal domain-containing protein [Alteripontixanthobacter maritimus]RDC59138.1 Flagellar motor switch protein FliG [Alteripontixanthobacter maritimus]
MTAAPASTAAGINSEAERAAVIVMLLGDEEAAAVLAKLEPDELKRVGETMCAMGEIGPDRIESAIAGFIASADNEALPAYNRQRQVHTTMTRALGEMKADSLMARIAPTTANASLELARWLAPSIILSLVDGEHPQAIAVLLLLLEPEPAAEVLSKLPAATQSQVVERVARLGPVSASAVEMLDELLAARIAARFGKAALTMGGPREAAELINNAAASVATLVVPAIGERDADLARKIEAEMFTFAMVLELDPKDMGRLIRDVDGEQLIDALLGLPEDDRDPVFGAMSTRAADGVRDEMELRGRIRGEDVKAAQKAIIALARKLGESGEIAFGAGDDDFV